MDRWTCRLCAVLVVLALCACGGGPDSEPKHQDVAAARKTFTYQVPPLMESGAKVTYSATMADGQPLPDWLRFDATTRTFNGTAPAEGDEAAPDSIRVTVTATGTAAVLAKTSFDLRVMQATSAVPQIINPAEELAAFDPHGILRWSAVAGADAYEVWVYRDASLTDVQEFSGALDSRQYQFTNLAGNSTYYVKLYFRANGAWADAPAVTINTTMVVLKPRFTNSQEELEAIHTGGTLRWTTISGADVYELWLFRDAGLEAFAETSGQVRIPQYQLRTLEAGRTYHAQVYSRVNGVFHVGAPLPIQVVGTSTVARIVNPQEELDAFATNGLLRWTPVTGATSYEAWIFTNPNSSESYESSGPLSTRSYATRTLQPGSTYYAQIYALVNGQWQVGSPVKLVTTTTPTIARFTNPQEELEAFATNGTLRWTEVPGATRYDVWIYGNAGLGTVAESGVGANRVYTVEKLCRDATYYAQVYALVNGQWTVGWATRIDVTQGTSPANCVPPAPDVRLSASATEVTAGQSVTLTWSTKFAQSCTASDGWSGATPLSGQATVGPITQTTLYTLTCTGASGASRAQLLIATVAVVPNVVGLTTGAADAAITAAGFVVGTVTPAASNTVPAGRVISQNPPGGQFVVSGGKVNYVVSTGSVVAVPNVVGMARNAAITAITSAGLTVGMVSGMVSTRPIEEVISQSPPGGQLVAPGSPVNLVYSTGGGLPQIRTVPDVMGMTQAEATSAITSAGLTVGTVTTASSATVPEGRVSFQNPYAGLTVLAGSPVNLVISTGSSPVTQVVPNVVGMTQAAATSAITTAGLTVGSVTTASSATVPAGSVISQNPEGGVSVLLGTQINLVLAIADPSAVLIAALSDAIFNAEKIALELDEKTIDQNLAASGLYFSGNHVIAYKQNVLNHVQSSFNRQVNEIVLLGQKQGLRRNVVIPIVMKLGDDWVAHMKEYTETHIGGLNLGGNLVASTVTELTISIGSVMDMAVLQLDVRVNWVP